MKPNRTISFEQGLSPTKPVNPITFNSQKIFADPTIFYCKDGSYLKQESNSNINLKDKSAFILESGSTIEITADAKLVVTSGSTLQIKSGAILKIIGTGRIEVENGGYICIEQGASLNLVDGLSVINLRPGYNIGVNTNVIPDPGNCLSDPANAPITGNGSINSFTDDIYIQNETISSDRYISGENIYVGRAVTTAKPIGNVVINNNARVIFEGTQNVNLEGGFEVNTGSAIEVK